ncbi:hypothetical protein M407DRAFT_216913 [Tulasnella calospora MUT 4182]|uniref:Uncharacterized protein n=1 Tax=Tulasnella calospora MUT 4182 TaxID=1051891 RepID=A0A0C3QAV9_9AGAM|nr:hypothetical protein M407DRAFT_216913 [Tulasnella calospora MUT 4182]
MADSTIDTKAPLPPLDEPEEEQPTLTFHGTNGVECEDFINNACRALEQDRIPDNYWLVTFAGSCCRDGALEFLDSLDHGIEGDWKHLRKALLKKYPAPLERELSSVLPCRSPSSVARSLPEPAPSAAPPSLPSSKPLAPLPKPDPSAGEASFRGQT